MVWITMSYRLARRRHSNGKRVRDVHWSAILVENKRIKGRPTQQHIAYVVGFTESAAKIEPQRYFIWNRVAERLDKLGNRITADERARIEAAIAQKVPMLTQDQKIAVIRRRLETLGEEEVTKEERELLDQS
jgi:hypothetical protein